MKSARAPIILVTIVALALTACARRPMAADPSGLDPKFALSSYIEDGRLVALIAGTRPTRITNCGEYMPLEIGIANKGLKSLSLTPESFTLIDASGTRYPVVDAQELYDNYRRVDTDRRLGEVLPVLRGKYIDYTPVPSNFTPSFDRPIDRRRLYLPRYSFTYDLLYFPCPPDGVRGRTFELLMTAPELADAIFVRLAVGGTANDSVE